MDELEKEILALSLDEVIERCNKDSIDISDEQIVSYIAQFDVNRDTAIREIYLSMIEHYKQQEEAMQEVYSDIIRSSY